MTTRMHRRRLLGSSLSGVMAAVSPGPSLTAQTDATPAPTGVVRPPAWTFQVHQVQDPYAGTIQVPEAAPPGTRYVGVEVEVGNDAEQALNFTPIDVYLRLEAGIDVRGGSALGVEPSINPRNLNPGERSRGWVWFIVPEDAIPVEVVYIAPPPQFRVPLAR